MIFYKIQILFFICLGIFSYAQDSLTYKKLRDEYGKEYYYDHLLKARVYMINGEKVVIMDEMEIQTKPKFNNHLDKNYYNFLNKKLNRVYPLFLTALQQYRNLQKEITNMQGSEKRQYIKVKQNELALQYESQPRDLTTSEGQVFAKLMCRATGKTIFEIIKELKGGFNAFIWNIKGNIAEVDIKKGYNPRKNRDDEYIESLLISNWQLGHIKPYDGYQRYTPRN
jgi:hypothetical protein